MMKANGQAGASSARLERLHARRSLPIGQNVGTLAVMLATLTAEGGEWLRVISKTEACIHEMFRLVGTPACLDLFVDFYHEMETPQNFGSVATGRNIPTLLGARCSAKIPHYICKQVWG